MTRVSIRRLDVVRAANIAAVLYAVIILVFGLLFFIPFVLLAGVAGMQVEGATPAILGAGAIGAIFAFVIAAVFYAIFGWIFTAILVALFNLVAGRLGGLQADVVFESPLPGAGGVAPYAYPPGYSQPPMVGQPPTPPANWGQPQG